MDHVEIHKVLDGLNLQGFKALEFGPLNRPKIRTEHGAEVYYIDHATLEELKSKYPGDASMQGVELMPIHFVADGRPLRLLTKEAGEFDLVVASHVIEHVPDLIGWLKDAVSVLKVGGVLALVVPDKRFTFDILRPLATHREIVAAHTEARSRPGLRCIMDHFANVTDVSHVETWHLWDDYTIADRIPYVHGPEFLDIAAKHYAEGRYIDVHCWVFTPWSFIGLIGWMCRDYGLDVDLSYLITTQERGLDFNIRLTRTSGGTSTDWEYLADYARQTALWPPYGQALASKLGLAT
jgi:SAM-dependent methyltransferase